MEKTQKIYVIIETDVYSSDFQYINRLVGVYDDLTKAQEQAKKIFENNLLSIVRDEGDYEIVREDKYFDIYAIDDADNDTYNIRILEYDVCISKDTSINDLKFILCTTIGNTEIIGVFNPNDNETIQTTFLEKKNILQEDYKHLDIMCDDDNNFEMFNEGYFYEEFVILSITQVENL